MISQELLSQIQQVDDRRIEVAAKTPEGIALLQETYYQVFGEHYTQGCGPCHEQAFLKLMKVLHNPLKFIPMSEKKYLLKEGHQVSVFGSPDIYTNDNLTDAIAKDLLKERPALKGSFQIIAGKQVEDEVEEAADEAPAKPAAAVDLIAKIEAATTRAEVQDFLGKDTRKTVVEAAKKRTESLPEEPATKVLTQADLDEDPELAAQGFKVGDTVKIEEE
ncbi:hypothetical protein [Pedobacter sp. SYP-B3415]|uniref:hypothetical protein n=1 Tax=Pedobacter sp. SYP-B3415 TaxID=2496641 RepID=UPI00101D44C1|nr:hypothetical protein [Pedobacter sp. SYP-B3415]